MKLVGCCKGLVFLGFFSLGCGNSSFSRSIELGVRIMIVFRDFSF